MNLAKQQVPVRELLERSVSAFKPMADAKSVKLESIITEGEGAEKLQLYCDPDRIHQVLCNLISNAIKFVPPDEGIIEVSAVPLIQDSSVVVFSVKDNGIGIPPEKQKGLFTKFYQVDTSLTRNVGGTGLGLTIAKGIVEAHGGKLWVESEQAKGSIFHFSIPMEDKK
jgi:signal transduction histidine kinase